MTMIAKNIPEAAGYHGCGKVWALLDATGTVKHLHYVKNFFGEAASAKTALEIFEKPGDQIVPGMASAYELCIPETDGEWEAMGVRRADQVMVDELGEDPPHN
jgi:hypothetical protein